MLMLMWYGRARECVRTRVGRHHAMIVFIRNDKNKNEVI